MFIKQQLEGLEPHFMKNKSRKLINVCIPYISVIHVHFNVINDNVLL